MITLSTKLISILPFPTVSRCSDLPLISPVLGQPNHTRLVVSDIFIKMDLDPIPFVSDKMATRTRNIVKGRSHAAVVVLLKFCFQSQMLCAVTAVGIDPLKHPVIATIFARNF